MIRSELDARQIATTESRPTEALKEYVGMLTGATQHITGDYKALLGGQDPDVAAALEAEPAPDFAVSAAGLESVLEEPESPPEPSDDELPDEPLEEAALASARLSVR
jgi:hypothetical protein